MHLPRALLLALMLTTGIVAVVAYSQAGASLPAVGAVVASDEALLALACGDGESAQGAPADPICQVEGGRLILNFGKYAELVPGEHGGYNLEDLEVGTQYGSPAPSNHWY